MSSNLAQLVRKIHNICKVVDSNPTTTKKDHVNLKLNEPKKIKFIYYNYEGREYVLEKKQKACMWPYIIVKRQQLAQHLIKYSQSYYHREAKKPN